MSNEKQRRSVELEAGQIRYLQAHIKQYSTITDAAISLGISKDVLSRTIAFGSCSEKTYNKLFAKVTA